MNKKILLFLLSFCSVLFADDIPLTTDSRIRTLVYNPNEVYALKFHYGFQSFIEFAADENIDIISLGEAYPWKITPIGKRLFIRPVQIDIKTNMTIITTKRVYQFEIEGLAFDEKSNEDLIYSVRFFYPEKEIKKPTMTSRGDTINVKDGFALDNIERGDIVNFNYSMAGRSDFIAPIKVFDDGKSTYFQFKNNNTIIPQFSLVDIYGNETKLDHYVDGEYIVVRATGIQFALRNGREIVCIFNNSIM